MDRCLTLSRAEPFCGRNTQLPNTTSYLYSGTPAQSEGQQESLCTLQEGCTGLTCVPRRVTCSSSTEEEESCPLLAFLSDIAGTTLIFQMCFLLSSYKNKQDGEYHVLQLGSVSAWVHLCLSSIKRSKVCWTLLSHTSV